MLKRLDQLADRSCWISGDRINASVGVEAHGITEVGFHGVQPVSRNSRMLARERGVLSFFVSDDDGRGGPVPFHTVDWHPHRVSVDFSLWGRAMRLDVLAMARALVINVTGNVDRCRLVARFFPESCTTQVRGTRTWKTPDISGRWLTLESRDLIRLHDWLRQEGPYAGDFLIPEPWRRELFGRRIRSGQATVADLRPEYRDADIPLYDACTVLRIGGERCTIEEHPDHILFQVLLESDGVRQPALIIAGADHPASEIGDGRTYQRLAELTEHEAGKQGLRAPRFTCTAAPEVTEWSATVPAIVRSCTVSELGMTRATPGAYYWLWAWDNLVTGMESLRWGEYGLVAGMVRFINSHRDSDGSIPARWTRSGLPLDTPPRGALEFLVLHLVYQYALETGNSDALLDVYPHAVSHLRAIGEQAGGKGFVPNCSFYPDLPFAFGRTEQSVVAMETGCLYAFARVLENASLRTGDEHTLEAARHLASHIETEFLSTFWDNERGFLVDAVDADTGEWNTTYPIFSLLFLQTSLGLALIRRVLPEMARFMMMHLQTAHGTRMLPSWDPRRGSEEVAASWYPHWDLYLLKVLRRAGEREGIMRWLSAADQALRRLGYVPEFLKMDGLAAEDSATWRRHGAVSNLNCVTGWYHCVLEGLCGIDVDPGGMNVIPLDLPLGPLRLKGMRHKRTRWDVRVEQGGSFLEEIRIDGKPLRGAAKVPAIYDDGGEHELCVQYGHSLTGPRFREILNAEVLESEGDRTTCAVQIRALGTVDIIVDWVEGLRCECDDVPLDISVDMRSGIGTGRIVSDRIHTLTLYTKQ
jgi:hypothetical protein